jgi:hypothetical protein
MQRWKLVVVLVLGVLYMLACEEQKRKQAAESSTDSPVAGVWYLESVGDGREMEPGVDVSFDFRAHGSAVYERRPSWPDQPVRFDLRYNLAGDIISIDSNELDPAIPRITGQIELADDGKRLEILTHSEQRWVLTREATARAQTTAVETTSD